MECQSKLNVTQNGVALKRECNSNGMLLKMDCHLEWNVTQNGLSLKLEYHS